MDTKPLAPGTILKGKYRLTRLVAGGGMAWVYEAVEQASDGSQRLWAIKELRADLDDAHTIDEGRRLFSQEANILVRLSHPNLPQVSAFFEERGRSYLVMEFIRGESLEKRLVQANAPLLESQVVEWALQICDVLAYLHDQPRPVIFRDLKPSNILVTPEGRIKLIDFGIARTYKAGQQRDTLSMGSENYAAPEQWGKAQSDARADIYGLGATMYHLLTNVPPLPAFVPSERVPLKQYNPAVSDGLAAVVALAMAPEREHRHSSAQAMREALLACLPLHQRLRWQTRRAVQASPNGPAARSVSPPARPPTARPSASGGPATQTPPREAASASQTPPAARCPGCNMPVRPEACYCRRCGQALAAPRTPVLAVAEPAGARWEYPLRSGEALIGRRGGERSVDLDLGYYDPEGYVSRNHCRIRAVQRRYELVDLDSANGTLVNGRRLAPHSPHLLRHGDRIRLGKIVLEFRLR